MAARLAHGLAAGEAGAVLDIAQRVGQWREARAAQEAWRRAEPRLIRGPDDAEADPVAAGRPDGLPDGPVERYQQQRVLAGGAVATTAGAASAWLVASLTGRSRRASTVALAALVGTQLGQTLLAGGVDRHVLLASLGSAG